MVKHIVMFKIKEEYSVPQKAEILQQFKQKLESLPSQINLINFFEVGLNFAQSAVAYDLVLSSEFSDLEALKSYAVHPAHLEVVEFVNKVASSRVIVDYQM